MHQKMLPFSMMLTLIFAAVLAVSAAAQSVPRQAQPAAATQPQAISFLGMNTYFTGLERIPPTSNDGENGIATLIALGREANIPWAREEIGWANLEPNYQGGRNWYLFDDRLAQIADAGYGIVGMISTTPKWARVDNCNTGLPDDRLLRYPDTAFPPPAWSCPPADVQDFAEIVGSIVERYDGDGLKDADGSPRVAVWQMWNEPNAWETWPGSPAEYGALLQAGYAAVKEADPTAIVTLGGVYVFDGWTADPTNGSLDGLDFYGQVFDAVPAAWNSFDALPIHPYMTNIAPDQPGVISWVTLWGRLTNAQNWLRSQAEQFNTPPRPLWISEIGWATCAGPQLATDEGDRLERFAVPPEYRRGSALASDLTCWSEEAQANYMVRTHAIAKALGVQHLSYLQLEDKFDGAHRWGGTAILHSPEPATEEERESPDYDPHYEPKVAYNAYRVMAQLLAGATLVGAGPLHTYSHVHSFEHFTEPANFNIRLRSGTTLIDVIWRNAPGSQVDMQLEPGYEAELITRDGTRTPLIDAAGQVSFTIGEEPVYVRQTLLPTPTPTATATATPTPTATATPTPTPTPTATATPTPTPTPTITPIVSTDGWITLERNQSGLLRYEDGSQLTEIHIPANAVTRTTTISYTASYTTAQGLPAPLPEGIDYAGRGFSLKVYEQGIPQPDYTFEQPICIVLEYDANGLTNAANRPLHLYRFDGSWQQESFGTCSAQSQHAEDTSRTTTSEQIDQAGAHALVQGMPFERVYLPLVTR
jgi:hypothetical protein